MTHTGNSSLPSWHEGPSRSAIMDFVNRVTDSGSGDFVPPQERVAVFDNDGTLWCEKPTQNQMFFTLSRLAAQAETDAALRAKQPWQAAYENDLGWLSNAITKHYNGDDSDLGLLMAAVPTAFAGLTVEKYADAVAEFFQTAHPGLHRKYIHAGYQPMVELLEFLAGNGFATYIASGGDRDFMRPVAGTMYGIPPERVIGSSLALKYAETDVGTDVLYQGTMDSFNDGPTKPVHIWSRIGRRPTIAVGNANGDIPMIQYAGGDGGPALRMLVLHDDADREFSYTAGAETALERATSQGWTVISMKDDWSTVFAGQD